MVEEFIYAHGGEFKKTSLWRQLPKKIPWKAFCMIWKYFSDNNMIALDRYGHVCWIRNTAMVQKIEKRGYAFP